MKRTHNKHSYLQEMNYLDWYSMGTHVRQCELTLDLVVEDMNREIRCMEEYKPELKVLTPHLHNALEIILLCTDRLHELSEYCDANYEKEA